jgi:hypothetical protein
MVDEYLAQQKPFAQISEKEVSREDSLGILFSGS